MFNTNIFLDNNDSKGYTSDATKDVTKYGFTRHDPISNFIFLKAVYENSLIEADDVLSNILGMTKKEYIDAIQARYGLNI